MLKRLVGAMLAVLSVVVFAHVASAQTIRKVHILLTANPDYKSDADGVAECLATTVPHRKRASAKFADEIDFKIENDSESPCQFADPAAVDVVKKSTSTFPFQSTKHQNKKIIGKIDGTLADGYYQYVIQFTNADKRPWIAEDPELDLKGDGNVPPVRGRGRGRSSGAPAPKKKQSTQKGEHR